MVSAILSIVLGLLSWLGLPIVVAVIGLALGINAILKERQGSSRNRPQMWLALGGSLICGVAVVAFFLGRYFLGR